MPQAGRWSHLKTHHSYWFSNCKIVLSICIICRLHKSKFKWIMSWCGGRWSHLTYTGLDQIWSLKVVFQCMCVNSQVPQMPVGSGLGDLASEWIMCVLQLHKSKHILSEQCGLWVSWNVAKSKAGNWSRLMHQSYIGINLDMFWFGFKQTVCTVKVDRVWRSWIEVHLKWIALVYWNVEEEARGGS